MNRCCEEQNPEYEDGCCTSFFEDPNWQLIKKQEYNFTCEKCEEIKYLNRTYGYRKPFYQ